MNQVKLPAVFFSVPQHEFPEIAQVSVTFSLSATLCSFQSLFTFFLPFTSPSFLLFSRESSVLKQREEEEEREQLRLQCESDPTAIHGLPLLSRSLQERRSQSVQDNRLAFSHNCITVEPAVGLCVCVSVVRPLPLAQYLSINLLLLQPYSWICSLVSLLVET